jgi:hypothetical protein
MKKNEEYFEMKLDLEGQIRTFIELCNAIERNPADELRDIIWDASSGTVDIRRGQQ